jgi:transglutaminase-like putative cysteine protease
MVNYTEGLPTLLFGSITNTNDLSNFESKKIIISNYPMIQWNISLNNQGQFILGVSSQVLSNGYIIKDLEGTNALTIDEIEKYHSDLIDQFCKNQYFKSTCYLNPSDISIKQKANTIKANANSNNSLIIAKEIFKWLKGNTQYSINEVSDAQPADLTFKLKSGDCDDLSYLYISLCRSLNIPSRFINGYVIDEFDVTAHAWVEVFVGGNIGFNGWIPVECAGSGDVTSEIHQNFGVEDVSHVRTFVDDGSNDSLRIASSGIFIEYSQGKQVDITSFVEISNYTIITSNELCITDETRNYC